jgi:hypothetical protein
MPHSIRCYRARNGERVIACRGSGIPYARQHRLGRLPKSARMPTRQVLLIPIIHRRRRALISLRIALAASPAELPNGTMRIAATVCGGVVVTLRLRSRSTRSSSPVQSSPDVDPLVKLQHRHGKAGGTLAKGTLIFFFHGKLRSTACFRFFGPRSHQSHRPGPLLAGWPAPVSHRRAARGCAG